MRRARVSEARRNDTHLRIPAEGVNKRRTRLASPPEAGEPPAGWVQGRVGRQVAGRSAAAMDQGSRRAPRVRIRRVFWRARTVRCGLLLDPEQDSVKALRKVGFS